jgi:proprotein convertase subtilisin/kexin type 5
VETCPEPYYGDPSTRTCVLECPLIQLLFADNSTRECVKKCPPMSYADKKSKFCVKQCPLAVGQEKQTYAADYSNVCVEECSLPTFSYEPALRCFTKCPDPYYSNVTDHKCYLCPGICTSCTSPTACTSCISNYYLQNGECVLKCSGLYYANLTSMKCVVSAECKPYFGVNQTNMCTEFCPSGQWKNTNLYRCDACPSTCETCTS